MRSFYLLLTCFLVLAAAPLSAQNYIWTGAVDSLWSNVNNWEVLGVPPATLPSPTDNVEILGPSTRRPHVDIVNATCNDFYIEFDELNVNIGQQLSIFGDLQLGDGGDVRLQSNARLQIAGNLDNSNSNGNIFSQPGSRVVFFGPGNSAIINPITLFDVTVNKEANARVYNQPRCLNGSVGTPIIIQNNLTIDKGVLAIADIDGINGINQVTPELDVRGNITINNGGCLDLSGFIDRNLGCTGASEFLERIRIHLGGNLADNTAPFPPTNVRGFFIGSTTINATGGRRPVMVFNGVKDQTVLGQYPLTNAANTPNQGSGLWLPRIIIDKPDPAKRVAMLTNVRLYGNAILRSGVFLLNSKRLLYGENNGDLLDIVLNGTLYANDNSEIYMYANGGGMDGSTLRAYDGGHLKLYGSPDQRVTITRDAPAPGNHYRTAVYSGGRVSARYADYNFQSRSNAGFNRAKLVGAGALLPVNCACNDPASECYLSQGGMKVFAGAILDPENLGANFSDCAFSAAANGTTALLFNVASGVPHELNNVVLNGANETTLLDPQFGFPAGGSGYRTLCNGGTSGSTNIISNNAGTIILVIISSGLIGGEIFGENYDAGLRDYRVFDGTNFIQTNDGTRLEYPTPGSNDHIIFTGRTFAIWIGRGNNDNWNNIDNWSTKEISTTAIPGTLGNEEYTVIIPQGSRVPTVGTGNATLFQNVPVEINGAMYLSLQYPIPTKYLDNSLGIYPAGTTYTIGTGNRTLQVNTSRALDINNDLFIMNNGVMTMQNTAPFPSINVAGSWFMHFGGATFNRGGSTATVDGQGVQQIRTRNGNGTAQFPNTTNAFHNFVVNKPSSTLFVQNNNLAVLNDFTHISGEVEFFTGMNLRVDGDFVYQSGNHIWNFSALFFAGDFLNNGGNIMAERSCIVFNAPDNSTNTIRTFNQAFNYIIFQSGTNRTYNLDGNLTILNSDGAIPAGAQAWFTTNNYNSCRIQSGSTVNVNGFVMRTQRFLVEAGATLNLNAGAGVRGAELLVYGGDDPVSYFAETDNKFRGLTSR